LLAKTKVEHLLLLLAIGVVALISARPARAQTSNSCAETDLPGPVIDLIKAKFSGWRPEQLPDLAADDQQLWVKAHGNQCPGTAVGHFESPDHLSYAVLLVPQSDPTGGCKLLVFTSMPSGDGYAWKTLVQWNGKTYTAVVISKAPPGRYSDYEHSKISVTTSLDGVFLTFQEQGADLYYWSAGRYKTVRVSG
jgi:hypothetical protein